MQSNTSRRTFLAGAAAVAVYPIPAFALNTEEARRIIDKMIAEVNDAIESRVSEARMIADFEKIFARYADVPIIARSALGIASRSASNAQMQAFTDAFRGYMARKYGKRFQEFSGGKLEVLGAKKVKSFYEVSTTALIPGSAPFDVKFLVSDKSGKDLFFNMVIEGINMLATERAEIGAMLDKRRGDIDLLIRDLKRAG